MRVIYLVRGAQLLLTLRALWMLYSVSHFCEKTRHSMKDCPSMTPRIPLLAPDQIAEHDRIRHLRPASNHVAAAKITSNASTTTAPATARIESSTVSTTEEVKNRNKRDERRVLPENGIIDPEHRAAAAVEMKKDKEEKKGELKSTPEVKTEATTEAKAEEKKEEVTTPAPAHHDQTTIAQNSEHSEVKESKVEVKKVDKKEGEQKPAPEVKTEAKVDEKKGQNEDKKHPSVEKKEEKTAVKKDESVHSTTEASKEPKKEKKEHLGAKVDIPVASNAHHDKKPAEGKIDPFPSSSSSEEKHHTVKKDLKAHVQEPVKIEDEKKELPPKLSPVHEAYVKEFSDAFLLEVRCIDVTSDDYFGKQLSPYAQHLRGLLFAGPVLVVICVYLVCTVLRARLGADEPNQFTDTLGCAFHCGMWLVVALSMFFIYDHWTGKWSTLSAATFAPAFPCEWSGLMMLALLMVVATAVEGWCNRRLYDDVVFERAYRCYEVVDTSESTQGQGHFARLSSPRSF